MKEEWKQIEGFDGYEVSSHGRVRSYRKRNSEERYTQPKLMRLDTLKTHCKEYKRVDLMIEGVRKKRYVHRLVAIAFIENPKRKPQVHHKDNDGLNNNVNNLEWVTNSENQRYRHGKA